jgi:flagellar hook assembly protein FlgD
VQEHLSTETIISVYPNPTKDNSTISYSTQQSGNVTIKILDQLGQQVTELYNGEQAAGNHSVIWNGKNSNGQQVPAGIYFIRIISGNTASTAKVIIAK